MPITQFPNNINLSQLNGKTGFNLTGITPGDQSGWAVSGIGDINADGIDDFVITAPSASVITFYGAYAACGAAYVVFGQSGIGSSGTLSLTKLYGKNGFTIIGPNQYQIGYSVNGAGDVNGDGISDLIISAPFATYGLIHSGVSYVVFGKSNIGASGLLYLSSLAISNGFSLSAIEADYHTGYSISSIGDLNADGVDDFIMGAPGADPITYGGPGAGISYVVFGGPDVAGFGFVDLLALNGLNGFSIIGHMPGDASGTSVSGAGDVNADGIADLIIGAPGAGVSYVVFGRSGIGSSGSLLVTNLNGDNGFAIVGGYNGYYVGNAGDINNDGITDIVAGSNTECYVIFGANKLGSSGEINISTLDGSNGFQIDAALGTIYSAKNAGDINVDGITDLIITGSTSYIVFGNKQIGNNGLLNLTTLNGNNGFSMPTSYSASQTGDINADGIDDFIIGSPNNNAGISYVIFGEKPISLSLLSNELTILEGQTVVLNSTYLSASFPANPSQNPQLLFIVSAIQHGQFSFTHTNEPISSFQQWQIQSGQIQFTHDGSGWPPAYNVSIEYINSFAVIASQAAKISFQQSFGLVNNNLIINQGETITITPSYLNAADFYNPSNTPNLIFAVSRVQHGYFASIYNQTIPIPSFSQQQLQNGEIQFVADGGDITPSYQVAVLNGAATTVPQTSLISFNLPPILINNYLSINQGQTTILKSINLSAKRPGSNSGAANFTFTVSNVEHGYFSLVGYPSVVISSFTQQNVQNKEIQFISDGSFSAPIYNVTVSDGKFTTQPQTCEIVFNKTPILVNNTLVLNQGESVVLTTANLGTIDSDADSANLNFIVSGVSYGHFALSDYPLLTLSSFTQEQVQAGEIQFVSDGSTTPPSYSVTVSDGKIATPSQLSIITFNTAPVLTSNSLTINQGQTLLLSSTDLSATDLEINAASLVFIASGIYHGHFEEITNPGTSITRFLQSDIISGTLQFIADGSSHSPEYSISVSDGKITTPPSAAIVNFIPSAAAVTTPASSSTTTVRNGIIGGTVSGVFGLFILGLKIYLTRQAAKNLKKSLSADVGIADHDCAVFYKEVIRPIGTKVFERINTTGFLGYCSERNARYYVSAIECIIGKLVDLGLNLNFKDQSIEEQNQLIVEIARQTKKIADKKPSKCSRTYIYSLFTPLVTPQQLEKQAVTIAVAVYEELNGSNTREETLRSTMDA